MHNNIWFIPFCFSFLFFVLPSLVQVAGDKGHDRGANQGPDCRQSSCRVACRGWGGGSRGPLRGHHGTHGGSSKDDGVGDLLHLHRRKPSRRDSRTRNVVMSASAEFDRTRFIQSLLPEGL